MNEKEFTGLAKAMELQQKEGKKDQYIEITKALLEVPFDTFEEKTQRAYAKELENTLSFMDCQIYELYRSLQDRLMEVKRLLTEEEKEDGCFDVTGLKKEIEVKALHVTGRSACLQVGDGLYKAKENLKLWVNDREYGMVETVVTSVYDLLPDKDYVLTVADKDKQIYGEVRIHTKRESVTLNVRDFGAKGDGVSNDNPYIQAAILACPKDGRVLIPEGIYNITSLFLKSNISLELAKNAQLRGIEDHTLYPVFPAMIPLTDGSDDYNLGTWEGNPLVMYSGVITGVEVENVDIYGQGIINGNASKEDWWKEPKKMKEAYRPRLVFLNHCKHITLQGVTLKNSPSWTMHPYFSDDLGFYNVEVDNPFDSPNTDGLDPESCHRVEIAGVKFSLGDDCIAVKSGKIYMGRKTKRPSSDIHISHCLMENGHGAVTVGSEMAGGVRNLIVENCVFAHTDRGLRIKTRRGRGKDAILDNIIFRNIEMDHVMTPFVVNTFYFCDPDGKTEYVQSREIYPVDDRTPEIKTLCFENIKASNCHVAGAYIEGLPEKKIEQIVMKNVEISYAKNPKCDVPAMSNNVEACSRKGIFIKNVDSVVLQNVKVSGQEGEAFILDGIDKMEGDL